MAVAATAIFAGCRPGGPPSGPGPAGPPEVTVAQPLILPTLDWDPYTGRLAAIEEVDVRARVSGYLLSHHFEEGQMVDKGQLLFVIDPQPYEATLAQATAERDEATAARRKAESQIAEAEAKRKQVEARIELADAQLNRARPLVPSGAISRDDFDVLVSEQRQAVADGYAADAEIETARAALAAAEAAIATSEASVRSAQLDLDYCRIESPITGRISRRQVTKGNLVSAGSLGVSALTTIVSVDPIHAYFDANEQALLKYIRLDRENKRQSSRDVKTPVRAAMLDEDGFPHEGYIDFVDNRVDRETGSIRARAIFPNPDESLVPGVFLRIRIPGSAPYDAVLIPESAIATDQASQFVFVLGEGDKLEARPVTTGPRSKGHIVIRTGLDGTERVVIRGLQRCRLGAAVKPTIEQLKPGPGDGLPDTYEPVPRERWLQPPNGDADPATTTPVAGASL